MNASPDRIDALLQRPAESLNVELKNWIDPRTPEGQAKIVKAVFALRNRNGGFLIIGFNNSSLQPDPYILDESQQVLFHPDRVQELISRHIHDAFEVTVEFRSVDGQNHPVIVVPEGVRIPASVKTALSGPGNKPLLVSGDIYFRTLSANGIPSSAKMHSRDLPALLEICFDNREADIGRFLRRQLGASETAKLATIIGQTLLPKEKLLDRAYAVIENGKKAFEAALQRQPIAEDRLLVLNNLTMAVGMALDPKKLGALPTQAFLNSVAGSNPQYTGWPVWLDGRSMSVQDRPYVVDGCWDTLINALEDHWSSHLEFMRFNPEGEFFLRRAMQDDFSEKIAAGTALDPTLMVYRVAEVLAVGINIARAIGWSEEDKAGFSFEWSGLDGRRLVEWADPMRFFGGGGGGESNSKTVRSFVDIPLDTPHSALAPHVATIVAPLFAAFDGHQMAASHIEHCVQRLIERKM